VAGITQSGQEDSLHLCLKSTDRSGITRQNCRSNFTPTSGRTEIGMQRSFIDTPVCLTHVLAPPFVNNFTSTYVICALAGISTWSFLLGIS
jgi:hypothetical protein